MGNEKKSKAGVVVLIIILLVVIAACVCLYIFKDKLFGKGNNTNTNNTATDTKDILTEYNGFKTEDHYYIDKIVKKSDGTETGYIVCELDEGHYNMFKSGMCVGGTEKYYSVASKEYSSRGYDELYALNDKYINAGYCSDQNNDVTCNVDILDIETGKLFKSLEGVAVYEKKIGKNISYALSNSMGDSCYTLLDENFNKVLGNYTGYAYEVNTDNTITILSGNKYIVFNFDGTKKYESKEYTEAIMVGQDIVIVNDNGSINVINTKAELVKTLTTVEGKWHSSQTDGGRNCYSEGNCEAIYLINENADETIKIEYNLETQKVSVEKSSENTDYIRLQVESLDNLGADIDVDRYSDKETVTYNNKLLKDNLPQRFDGATASRIDDVIVLALYTTGAQCDRKYLLIFDTDGKVLYDFTEYQTMELISNKIDKTLKISMIKSHECWCCACDGEDCDKKEYTIYKISGKTITEQ